MLHKSTSSPLYVLCIKLFKSFVPFFPESTITFLAVVFTPSVIVVVHIRIFKIF